MKTTNLALKGNISFSAVVCLVHLEVRGPASKALKARPSNDLSKNMEINICLAFLAVSQITAVDFLFSHISSW